MLAMKTTKGARALDKWLETHGLLALALKLGVDKSYLSHLRSGRRRPSLETAGKIERATEGAVPVAAWTA